MAPKKKDKSKTSEWLQCSLCGKLIVPADGEIHSKSCVSDHAFILGKCFTGKVVKAEDLLDTEKNPVTKGVRDKDEVVWLPLSVMTLCEIAIGQQVVVDKKLVKKAWPLTSGLLTNIGLSKQSREEVKNQEGGFLTVEKLFCKDWVVESVVLKLMDSNEIFEGEEFLSFVTSYLDGTFLAGDTQLRIKYFGQLCHCRVTDIRLRAPSSTTSDNVTSANLSDSFLSEQSQSLPSECSGNLSNSPVTMESPKTLTSTPLKSTTDNQSLFETSSNSNSCDGNDLSSSFSNLNIDNNNTSTPRTRAKCEFPNLNTPTSSHKKGYLKKNDGGDQAFGKVISDVTVVSVEPVKMSKEGRKKEDITGYTLKDLGGMSHKIEELKNRIYRAQQPGSLSQCILVHGPAGTGKTLLVRAVTNSLGVHAVYISGTDIWSKLFGQAESNLRSIFKTAADRSPSVVVIDDMDVICPKRSQQTVGQQEHRIVGTLLSLVDGVGAKTSWNSSVVVIGVTNNQDGIDPALRRSGRFGCEVEMAVPNPAQRAEILTVMLNKVSHHLRKADIESVATNAHGYVGADLTALINEASIHAVTRMPNKGQNKGRPEPISLTVEDLVYAGQLVKPSALKEIQLEVSEVRWSDIGGMSEVKMRLKEAVELPLTHPSLYKNLGIEPPRGLLMYGPPGCSKTMIARAVATECHLNFLAVKGPELFNQYVGESEKAIREVFRKARAAAPSVIFFDEIDAIAAKRGSGSGGSGVDDRVLTQLLTEMDGLEYLKDVFIMAATNRPDKIDKALLRPGRFDSLIYVPLPDDETRREILEKKLKKMKRSNDVRLDDLVEETLDYSGAEIIQLCQEAALTALRENIEAAEVCHCHFDKAFTKVLPQTDVELLQIYHKFSSAR